MKIRYTLPSKDSEGYAANKLDTYFFVATDEKQEKHRIGFGKYYLPLACNYSRKLIEKGETVIEFPHFAFETVKYYADYIHQKNLELEINDKLQLLELALWTNHKQLTRQIINEIMLDEDCLDNDDRVEIAISFIHFRQKAIQDLVADLTSEINLGQMDRLGGIMIRDVHKIKLDNNHFYGDGESIAGIILREMRQGDKELTHHNLGEEIRQRLKQLKRIDRPTMVHWDEHESHHELTFNRKDQTVVEQNHTKGWKFAVSKEGFSTGMHFWHIQYELSSFPEIPVLAFGICKLPIDKQKIMKKSIYNYEGVWTLSTQNGQCYHMGRVKQLQEVYPGDTVTIKLDLDNKSCQIAINGGMYMPVFTNLPDGEFHAYVNFSDDRGDRIDVVRCVKRSQKAKK